MNTKGKNLEYRSLWTSYRADTFSEEPLVRTALKCQSCGQTIFADIYGTVKEYKMLAPFMKTIYATVSCQDHKGRGLESVEVHLERYLRQLRSRQHGPTIS
jgi:hypothetical protein